MKAVIAALAAGMLAAPFAALVIAAPASAAPCSGGASMECVNCLEGVMQSGQGSSAGCGMTGAAPIAGNGPIIDYPDCDAMQDAIHKSNCLDQHLLAGQ